MRDIRNYYILAFFLIAVFVLDIILLLFFLRYKSVSNDYIKLRSDEKLEKYLSNKPCMVGVLASWCGYCKKLKESKVLEEVSKEYRVIEIDEKHPQAKELMQKAGCKGFPCLMVYKKGKINGYNKSRNYDSIIAALR